MARVPPDTLEPERFAHGQCMELVVETTDPEPHPGFAAPPVDLLTFLTFGASERYGALHPLSGVANILRRKHNVDLLPLFTFGDAVPDDDEDVRELERIWQDPTPLAACCATVIETVRATPRLQELSKGFPNLLPQLAELQRIAEWAGARDARIRITYRLD
jgi:glycine/D-amino acid oxidase-like deaminating enzyme